MALGRLADLTRTVGVRSHKRLGQMQEILVLLGNVKIVSKGRRCATFILAITDQWIVIEQKLKPEDDGIDLVNLGRIKDKNQILIGQCKDAPGNFRHNVFERCNCRADVMVTPVEWQKF